MTNSLRTIYFGILLFTLGVFAILTPTPAEASTCNLYSAATQVPNGYGASYNVFSTSKMLISLDCSGTTVNVTVGDNDPYTYVYNQGYIYKNNKWTLYNLSCSGGESLISGTWCPKQAKATISNAPQDATNHILAYACQWRNNAWKCGCKDTTCSTGLWQLQAYKPTPAPTPTPSPNVQGAFFNDDFENGLSKWSGTGPAVSIDPTGGKNGTAGLKIHYGERGTAAYSVSKNVSSLNVSEFYVKFDFKITGSFIYGGSKFLKVFGKSNDPLGNANSTWRLDYTNTWLADVGYGDGSGLSNDSNGGGFTYSGKVFEPGSIMDVARGTFSAAKDGNWHTFQAHMKFNTNGNRDGLYEVWIDGQLWARVTNTINRNDQNSMFLRAIEIGGYTNGNVGGVTPDWYLWYDNVVMSTKPIGG